MADQFTPGFVHVVLGAPWKDTVIGIWSRGRRLVSPRAPGRGRCAHTDGDWRVVARTVWWLAALVGFVVVFIGGRRLSIRVRERREPATDAEAELIRRADQQNRWATHGDSRGIYGRDGAE
jgi:hypothetical protein